MTARTLRAADGYRVTVENRRGVNDAGIRVALREILDQVEAGLRGQGEAA